MQLSDIEWGDVISDDDGVLVISGEVDGESCVVKRFSRPDHAREISNYELLGHLGVPTPEVLGHGDDWLAIEDLRDSRWMLAREEDAANPDIARWLARWYATLHAAGRNADLTGLYRETDALTPAALEVIAERWPELATGVAWAAGHLDRWQGDLARFGETLTYNDFAWANLAVDHFGEAAMMFDYNLLGRGYRYADVRNVRSGLTGRAADAFTEAYERLAGPLDPDEAALDEAVSHLVTLVFAAGFPATPGWAEASRRWLATR